MNNDSRLSESSKNHLGLTGWIIMC